MRSSLHQRKAFQSHHRSSAFLTSLYKKQNHNTPSFHLPKMPTEDRCTAIDIPSLRKASLPIFSNPGFRNILWAGVFGSTSRNEQTPTSDVDVVIVWDPAHRAGWQPLNDIWGLYLDEELEKAWGHEVDIIDIRRGHITCYVDVEALLTSRTLYGEEKHPAVVKARADTLEVLESGVRFFEDVSRQIRETRATVEGKTFKVVGGFARSAYIVLMGTSRTLRLRKSFEKR